MILSLLAGNKDRRKGLIKRSLNAFKKANLFSVGITWVSDDWFQKSISLWYLRTDHSFPSPSLPPLFFCCSTSNADN